MLHFSYARIVIVKSRTSTNVLLRKSVSALSNRTLVGQSSTCESVIVLNGRESVRAWSEMEDGDEVRGIAVTVDGLDGIATVSGGFLEEGGGGRMRRGGRGGALIDGIERGVDPVSLTSPSVSTGGRLGGYIEGVDGVSDGTGESIREFAVMAIPVKPLDAQSIAK